MAELPIGSEKFQHFCEGLQTTESPEDIYDQIEQRTGMCINEFSPEELETQIDAVSHRVIGWV